MGITSRRSGRQDDEARQAFERGQALFEEKHWAEAARELARAVDLAPDSADSQILFGVALMNSGHPKEALPPLAASVRLRPDSGEGYHALGMALVKLRRMDEADRYIVRAARLGHPQAAATMRQMDMDYCRKCHRAVYVGTPSEADIIIVSPKVGVECVECHRVLCIRCSGGGPIVPTCRRCGGAIRPLMR